MNKIITRILENYYENKDEHNLPSGLVDPFLQQILDLVVCDERLVARVCNGNGIPVVDDVGPGLEEASEYIKLEPRHVIVLSDVDCLLQSLGFGGSSNLVHLA